MRTPTNCPEHFWTLVTKTDSCWNYSGPMGLWGQRTYLYDGIREKAARFAYRQLVDPYLDETTKLSRRCDNPDCVNPDHHRTSPNGQKDLILKLWKEGHTHQAIADRLGFQRSTITLALKRWRLKESQKEAA